MGNLPHRLRMLFLAVNAIASLVLLKLLFGLSHLSDPLRGSRDFTYIGDDYPLELPLKQKLGYVGMTLHETVHYGFNTTDAEEWATLVVFPRGYGRVHLGQDHRIFNHVFWHQMHCLSVMQIAIRNRKDSYATPPHVRHCLNYLRQRFLCGADHMLEEGDFLKRDFERGRIAGERMCRDWDMIEGYLGGEKIQQFFDWKNQVFSPHPLLGAEQHDSVDVE